MTAAAIASVAPPLDVSMMGDIGWAGWSGMALMMLAMVALVGVVAWIIVRAVRPDHDRAPRAGDDALDVLRARYARGEITTQEFEERRDRLRRGAASG